VRGTGRRGCDGVSVFFQERADSVDGLDGVDLDLVAGRRVALVGPSGAGESTVAAVLLRFCDLAGGSATLGGHGLRACRADDVRTVIGGCTQDPHIFNASIRENLRLARPDASDRELAEAAQRARLLPWIEWLPLGWDTPAGTRGGAYPAGNASGSRWPGPCSPGRTC
jgi:ATP-binding cassette, subfamily C, bacterial CydC